MRPPGATAPTTTAITGTRNTNAETKRRSPRERIITGIKVSETGCWLWQRRLNHGGYGMTSFGGRTMGAHRVAYILWIGPIPAGLDLDHLCRVRHCVNPAPLEPVTRAENLRRSTFTGPGANAVKTKCVNGHPFTEANTYRPKAAPHRRQCRACKRTREAARRERSAS